MGLFDIFRKRKSVSTFPENEIEISLMQAAKSTLAQKEFYQKLLWNHLYVLTNDQPVYKENSQNLEERTTLHLVTFEGGQIPVFTSINRMYDKGIIKEQVSYIGLKGQDLFEVAKGATFVLNPYSEFGKELVPEEIGSLMDGTIYEKIDNQEEENKKNNEFNEIFHQGSEKQKGLILLGDYHPKKLKPSEKLRLEESINDFQKCLELVPTHWQSMMLMAKAFQRLERHTEALAQLELAFQIEKEDHFIPMEASLEAMHLNDLDKALFYSGEALKRRPNDIAVMGNHAMNLLIAQRDNEAKEIIKRAIEVDPNDRVNRNIESIVNEVISGKRGRPTFEDSIKM